MTNQSPQPMPSNQMPNNSMPTSPMPSQMSQPSPAQEIQQLKREKANLAQLLWELVRLQSPETHRTQIPVAATDPLWQLAFVAGSEGKIELLAGTIPELTEQEKKRIVRFLRGTTKQITEATNALELSHPAAYVEAKIADRIVWKDGAWQSVTPPDAAEKIQNAVHWPK